MSKNSREGRLDSTKKPKKTKGELNFGRTATSLSIGDISNEDVFIKGQGKKSPKKFSKKPAPQEGNVKGNTGARPEDRIGGQ